MKDARVVTILSWGNAIEFIDTVSYKLIPHECSLEDAETLEKAAERIRKLKAQENGKEKKQEESIPQLV